MSKVVFLFGAGASYGAGGITPNAPPLGVDLFDVLVREYPRAWGALGQPVARRFQEEGFEAGMGWIWQNMPQAPQILQKCLGHFFCLFGVGDADANAYVRLLRGIRPRLGRDPVAIATLNYEMVLEEAASLAGLPWNYGDVLVEGSQVLIIKPHGSCNLIPWETQIRHGSGQLVIDTGIGVKSKLRAVWRNEALAYCADPSNGLYPAMVAFTEGKPTQVSPHALEDMQRAFQAAVLSAERVAVVGVNPHVADNHIWDCVAETDAEVLFCGDRNAFDEWSINYRGGRPTHYLAPYFADAVDALVEIV